MKNYLVAPGRISGMLGGLYSISGVLVRFNVKLDLCGPYLRFHNTRLQPFNINLNISLSSAESSTG